MHIHIYTFIHIYTYIYIHIYIHIHTYEFTNKYHSQTTPPSEQRQPEPGNVSFVYVCVYICIYMALCMRVYVCVDRYIRVIM